MPNKKQHISLKAPVRVILFLLLAALLIHVVYSALRWKDTTGNYISSMDQLYATPANTIDVVFAGSSHCYAGVYPADLWLDKGIAAFDMAVSGQDKQSTYHDLVEVMKTQRPKVVFADLYGLTFEEHGVRSNEYRNMLAMHTSRNSIGLVKDYADRADWMDYILRWPIIHTRYRELQPFDFTENPLNTFGRGGLYDWDYNAVTYESSQTAESTPVSDTNRRWLDRMTALSDKYGFRLVYMILPYSMPEEDRKIYNGVKEYMSERGYQNDLIDFTEPDIYAAAGLDETMDFHDSGHLSGFGAEKVTHYFENYLADNHLLEGASAAQDSALSPAASADGSSDSLQAASSVGSAAPPAAASADGSSGSLQAASSVGSAASPAAASADGSSGSLRAASSVGSSAGWISDHRGDPAYTQWDQDYAYFNQTKYTWVLPRTESALSYCALLAQNALSQQTLPGTASVSHVPAESSTAPHISSIHNKAIMNVHAAVASATDAASEASHAASDSSDSREETSSRIPGLVTIISLEGGSGYYATDAERDGTSPVPAAGEINTDQDYTGIYDGYYAALSLLGMSREDYLAGGKWIYQNGQLRKIHGNDSDEESFSMDLSASDSLRAQYNGDFAQGNLMINMKDYSNADGRALHIVVCDDLTDQLVEARGF